MTIKMYACTRPLSSGMIEPQQKEITMTQPTESVDHPPHYVSHPSGIECIQITEHMGFNLGNAFKYIWRAELKGSMVEDLKKARWYLDREIAKREKTTAQPQPVSITSTVFAVRDTGFRGNVNFNAKPTENY